jgi:hypothetical protein
MVLNTKKPKPTNSCEDDKSKYNSATPLGNDHLTWFFSKKNILFPNVAEKNILILVEEKKNNLIQSFCHIT